MGKEGRILMITIIGKIRHYPYAKYFEVWKDGETKGEYFTMSIMELVYEIKRNFPNEEIKVKGGII